ncbi:MAG: hypothetical protein EA001_07165, partial [Oscillatoriales cyanobacterium]
PGQTIAPGQWLGNEPIAPTQPQPAIASPGQPTAATLNGTPTNKPDEHKSAPPAAPAATASSSAIPSPWDEDDEERQDTGRRYSKAFTGGYFPPATPATPPLPDPVPYQAPPGLSPHLSPIQPRPIATPAVPAAVPLNPGDAGAIVTQTTDHHIVEQTVEVYGRMHVNRLLSMMFPYQQSLNQAADQSAQNGAGTLNGSAPHEHDE